jgi:hypothetical protein
MLNLTCSRGQQPCESVDHNGIHEAHDASALYFGTRRRKLQLRYLKLIHLIKLI